VTLKLGDVRSLEVAGAFMAERAGGRLSREQLHVLAMSIHLSRAALDLTEVSRALYEMVEEFGIELYGQPGE
jgi:hypothetical protein